MVFAQIGVEWKWLFGDNNFDSLDIMVSGLRIQHIADYESFPEV